jgi:hypothetical protein
MTPALVAPLREPGLVRWLTVWVPLAAISIALVVAARPSWWFAIIVVDLWFLSFSHVRRPSRARRFARRIATSTVGFSLGCG